MAADLSAWEDDQRRKAAEELQQMELDAQLQAEVDKQQVGCNVPRACSRHYHHAERTDGRSVHCILMSVYTSSRAGLPIARPVPAQYIHGSY